MIGVYWFLTGGPLAFSLLRGSIRRKLLLIVLVATFPVFAVLLYSQFDERQKEVLAAERDTLIFLNGFSEVQRSITDSTRTLLRTVSELPEIRRGDPVAAKRILVSLLKANPIYTNVILVDRRGHVIAMGRGKDKGFDFSDRRQFRDAVRTKRFAAGEFVVGKQSNKSIFPFGMPVLGEDDAVNSVIIIGVSLSQYAKQYDHSAFPKESFFGMCDHRGTRIFRYPHQEGIEVGFPINMSVFNTVRDVELPGILHATTSEGAKRIVAYEPLRLTDSDEPYMYLFMGLDRKQVLASANQDLLLGTVVGLLSLCLALLTAWIIGSQTIAAKFDRLIHMANNLGHGAGGEFSGIDYGDGEMGALARTFDTVSNLLRKREDDLHAAKEAAESANRAKDEFLANISHEVRTPLNGVMGMLQVLRETKVDEEQKSILDTALQSSRNLLRVLNDLLDFIKVGSGKMELLEEPFDLEPFVKQSTELFQMQVEQKDIKLTYHVDPIARGKYLGDVGRIRQVVFNLLGNAIKFTPAGSIRIEVYTLPHPLGNFSRLFFSIEDSGIGIPEDKIDYVFDSFTQVDGSLSREHQGTGLGLPIVKKLVSLMSGNIVLESEEGVGTTVSFCVQVRDCCDTFIPTIEDVVDTPSQALVVLLAEDENVNRLMATRLLEKMGHTVHSAGNGLECLEVLASTPVDVVLMDIQMPVMDGLEATRRIRTAPEFASIADLPIVVLSAHAADQRKDSAYQSGVDDYLTKPFEKKELEIVLRRVVKRTG